MDLEINLDLETLIASLPEETKKAIRAVGGFACLVSDQVTFIVNLKVGNTCTLRGVYGKKDETT